MKLAQLALSFLLPVGSVYAELQLTPQLVTYDLDGVKLSRLAFTDGKEAVTYTPPRGWQYSGNATRLTLVPENSGQAQATITRVAMPKAGEFDEETRAELTRQILAAAPSGSTDVQLIGEEMDPLLINKKETFLVTMSYTLYGDTYGRSIMFMNRGQEQIRFQLTSRLSDFAPLQRAFLQSHYTWRNL